jgi:hypothetical protein
MKALIKIFFTVMVLIMFLSLFQWLQVLSFQGGNVRTAYDYNIRCIKEQGKIKLDFKVVDQYGNSVSNYPVKVAVISVRWYWWIFPGTRLKMRYYYIKTNEEGIAHFEPRHKGTSVEPLEVDNSKYRAIQCDSKLLWPEVVFNAENKRESAIELDHPVISLMPGTSPPKPIELRVIKHESPEELQHIEVSYRKGSFLIDISDRGPETIVKEITLSTPDEKDPYRNYWLTLKVIVYNGKSYAKAEKLGRNKNEALPKVDLVVEGDEGIEFVKVPDCPKNVPYAPEDGYSKTILINNKKEAYFIRNIKVNPPIYYRFFPDYYLRNDIFEFPFSADYNPTGSRNLYVKSQPECNSRHAWLALE